MKKITDRYLKIVEWSEEDQCYIGRCPNLMMGGVHGDDELQVYQELSQAVEEWIQIHQADGIPLPDSTASKEYSGKFMLRLNHSLHEQLALHAMVNGDSLNSYCKKVLSQYG